MIREALQVHAADIAFANREGFGPIRSLVHVIPKLRIKFIGKLSCPNPLVVPHDLVDIRIDLRMEDEPHQVRRRSIWCSTCSKERPLEGFASSSASRRSASAMPSSAS